jgi:hypothetical protein
MAFWSDRASPEEAASLARDWRTFLESNGATPSATVFGDVAALRWMGFTEVVCVRGRNLGGVHQAENEGLARRLAEAVCPSPGS